MNANFEDDEITPAQRARFAAAEQKIKESRKRGTVNGRDWTGALVEHQRNCRGTCCVRQVAVTKTAFNFNDDVNGFTWGGIAQMDEDTVRAAETPQQTAARLARDKAADEAQQAAIEKLSEDKKKGKWADKLGEMLFRVPRPCKYQTLFLARTCAGCNAKVPQGQTHCQAPRADGCCCNAQGQRICGEKLAGCWSHEKSQTCIYIHTDEPQWADACSGALCYDRQRRVFFKKGEGLPPVPQTRNFAGLAGDKRRQK